MRLLGIKHLKYYPYTPSQNNLSENLRAATYLRTTTKKFLKKELKKNFNKKTKQNLMLSFYLMNTHYYSVDFLNY